MMEFFKWIGDNPKTFGGIVLAVGALGRGIYWLIKKIWPGKAKPSVSQTTKGDHSPIISDNKGDVQTVSGAHNSTTTATNVYNINNGISLEDYEKNRSKIIAELEEKHSKEKEIVVKEKEHLDEKVKELQQKLEESVRKQPQLDENLKNEVTSLIENKKYDEAEHLLYYLLLKDKNNAAFNFQYASLKQLQLQYRVALAYYKIAVELELENALYLNDLGYQLYLLGEYESSIIYVQKAIDIDVKEFGEYHPNVAGGYINMAEAFRSLGKYEIALGYCQKATSITLKVSGENHVNLANNYIIYGSTYMDLCQWDEAIDYTQKALDIFLKVYGKIHIHIAVAYNNLGTAWRRLEKYEKAIDYYEKALNIYNEIHEKNHPDIGILYNNLGVAWGFLGKYEKAIDYYQKAYDIAIETLEENHPITKSIQENIEDLKQKMSNSPSNQPL